MLRFRSSDKTLQVFFRKVEFEKYLQSYAPYVFKCRLNGKIGVLKIFTKTGKSDGREYDVLADIKSRSKHPDLFPGTIDQAFPEKECWVSFDGIVFNRCYRVIVYEFVPGTVIGEKLFSREGVIRLCRDLRLAIDELYRLGYFHGDTHEGNAVCRLDGSCVFIDYGSAFSTKWREDPSALQPCFIYNGIGEERAKLERLLGEMCARRLKG